MQLGIVSDSHDHLIRLEAALTLFEKEGVDAVLHPGDLIAPFAAKLLVEQWGGPLSVVYGNNDGERAGLKTVLPGIVDGPILVELGGRRISLDHYPPDVVHRPVPDCDVVIFGHTHQVTIEERRGSLWLNPGECCGWVTGKATAALLDTETLKAEIVELNI
ncbi:phosphodiesterase [Planctomycetes bacterium Pan216]|uniref:Phosphoesterase n=1 Tax=Kolteria novifilia TaxID=2527975 RepID=A0A518BC13_9BACT|nr:phosphodiesterase [Planctomycetes bacterium Pan216]